MIGQRAKIWLGATLAISVGLVGPAIAETARSEPVAPRVALDRTVIAAGKAAPVYALIEFDIAKSLGDAPRPPINLALVLDRSGSMEDKGKIEYLREAAKLAVDRLTPADRLAVVDFDDRITVLWPSARLETAGPVKALIDRLTPRGSTDLAGGMMAGVAQAAPHVGREAVTRVLVLTDGLANKGVIDPKEIRALARQAKAQGVRISTIGLGLDYNESLLQAIAEVGGGSYNFVEHPRQMARIFTQELAALANTVAKDARLIIHPGSGAVRVTVLGVPSRNEGGDTVVDLEDFYAGETRSLLLKLEVKSTTAGTALSLGRIELAYADVKAQQPRNFGIDLQARASGDQAELDHATDARVTAAALIAEANQSHAASLDAYEAGRSQAASQQLQNTANDLAARNQTLNDPAVGAKIRTLEEQSRQMAAPAASPEAQSSMMKRNRQDIYNSVRGKQ